MHEHDDTPAAAHAPAATSTSPDASPDASTTSPAKPLRDPVPGLFSRHTINLVVGAPQSGRRSLILPQFDEYIAKGTFLDYGIGPGAAPALVGMLASGAGSYRETYLAAERMQLSHLLNPCTFPVEEWTPSRQGEQGDSDAAVLNRAFDHLRMVSGGKDVRLLLVDNFQLLMSSGKSNFSPEVSAFCRSIKQVLIERDAVLIGMVGTSKAREYPLLGQRVAGSTQWADESSTLIGVDETDKQLPEDRRGTWRQVIISPRGARRRVLYADFDDLGRLYVQERPTALTESILMANLDTRLAERADGEQFGRGDFLAWGDELKISRATVDRWIAMTVEVGMLERSGSTRSTVYTKPRKN